MNESPSPDTKPNESKPPLGSWPLFYVVTCVVATLYIVILYVFTATFNQAGGA